jgi:hypothetical protein
MIATKTTWPTIEATANRQISVLRASPSTSPPPFPTPPPPKANRRRCRPETTTKFKGRQAPHLAGRPELRRLPDRPTAILSPALEQFFPGQPETMHSWIGKDRSTLIKFTVAEGGGYHCEPMAPQMRNDASSTG